MSWEIPDSKRLYNESEFTLREKEMAVLENTK